MAEKAARFAASAANSPAPRPPDQEVAPDGSSPMSASPDQSTGVADPPEPMQINQDDDGDRFAADVIPIEVRKT